MTPLCHRIISVNLRKPGPDGLVEFLSQGRRIRNPFSGIGGTTGGLIALAIPAEDFLPTVFLFFNVLNLNISETKTNEKIEISLGDKSYFLGGSGCRRARGADSAVQFVPPMSHRLRNQDPGVTRTRTRTGTRTETRANTRTRTTFHPIDRDGVS